MVRRRKGKIWPRTGKQLNWEGRGFAYTTKGRGVLDSWGDREGQVVRQKPSFVGQNCLELDSSKGEFIGQGRPWRFSGTDAEFTARYANHQPQRGLSFQIKAKDGSDFFLEFAGPNSQKLAPGRYPNAARYPFQNPDQPGLSVSGCHRGANTLTGSFEIFEIVYGESAPTRFAADFVQFCEGDPSRPLRGSIRYYSSDWPG